MLLYNQVKGKQLEKENKEMKNRTNTELFEMVKETNRKILNAMYSGNNEAFEVESKNFDVQYAEILRRDLAEEYRVYRKEVA